MINDTHHRRTYGRPRTGLARLLQLTALLSTLALVGCGEQARTPPAGALDLEALRGQWVVINYWAVWCAPCIKEIPELNELDHANANITVLGVNFDGVTGEELAQQVDKLGIRFPNLSLDPGPQLGVARPLVLPTTLVITPDGQLRETLVGPQTLASLTGATIRAAE